MKPIHPNVKIIPRHPWAPENGWQVLYRETKAWRPHRHANGKLRLWVSRKSALDFLVAEGIIDPVKIGTGEGLHRAKEIANG